MFPIQPVRIYAGVEICQIFYHTLEGKTREYKSGKYQNNTDIQPSMLYKEFQQPEERQRTLWEADDTKMH